MKEISQFIMKEILKYIKLHEGCSLSEIMSKFSGGSVESDYYVETEINHLLMSNAIYQYYNPNTFEPHFKLGTITLKNDFIDEKENFDSHILVL